MDDADVFPTEHAPDAGVLTHAWWGGYATTDPSTIVTRDFKTGTDYSAISTDGAYAPVTGQAPPVVPGRFTRP